MKAKRQEGIGGGWQNWLIASYVVIVVLFALLWFLSIVSPLEQAEEEQQYESLQAVASAGAALLAESELDAGECVDAIASGDIRVTIIDADGAVMADSVDDSTQMDNHAQRTEVAAALAGEVGTERRVSETDGTEYLYLAMPATYQGAQVVLRTSVPASEVTEFASTFRTTSTAALLIAVLLTAFIAVFTFRRTSAPVNRLERVRTNFVANASHELKTPVAGIRLLSESIEQASKDGDYEIIPVFADRLRKESARLQNLVTELLDLSRLENSDPSATSETCDLRSVASTSYEGHVMQARARGIAFEFDDRIAAGETCPVALSAADAALIVDNLLENAVNYTEEGSVTLHMHATPRKVVLEVRDTGIGIPDAEQERIFERFYRVDTARSREMGGTGLGLSLVRHAVNRASGAIKLQSTPGQGSTFTVVLPKA